MEVPISEWIRVHLRSRESLNRWKSILPPLVVRVFRLKSSHYGESRGAPERGTSEDAPLVALCHKEWPYGGQSPWEEKKLEWIREELPSLKHPKQTPKTVSRITSKNTPKRKLSKTTFQVQKSHKWNSPHKTAISWVQNRSFYEEKLLLSTSYIISWGVVGREHQKLEMSLFPSKMCDWRDLKRRWPEIHIWVFFVLKIGVAAYSHLGESVPKGCVFSFIRLIPVEQQESNVREK